MLGFVNDWLAQIRGHVTERFLFALRSARLLPKHIRLEAVHLLEHAPDSAYCAENNSSYNRLWAHLGYRGASDHILSMVSSVINKVQHTDKCWWESLLAVVI